LQLSFVFWQSWQMREESWHFCQTQDNLPNANGPHPARVLVYRASPRLLFARDLGNFRATQPTRREDSPSQEKPYSSRHWLDRIALLPSSHAGPSFLPWSWVQGRPSFLPRWRSAPVQGLQSRSPSAIPFICTTSPKGRSGRKCGSDGRRRKKSQEKDARPRLDGAREEKSVWKNNDWVHYLVLPTQFCQTIGDTQF